MRRLVDHERFNVGLHHFTWDGRDAAGTVLLSGSYRPKVAFSDIHRTFALPNPIHIDVTRPTAHRRVREAAGVLAGRRRPRGRHHRELPRERARARPAARERPPAGAHVPGAARGLARLERTASGGKLPPGTYRLSLVALDLAGNRSRAVPAGTVRLRYLGLARDPCRAAAGATVRVPVDTERQGGALDGPARLERRRRRAAGAPSWSCARRRRPAATPSCSTRSGIGCATDRRRQAVSPPPLLVLGVRRSGTTLLRVVLDRHSQLAIPDESYFVPQLADRQRGRIDVDAFVDDLRRLKTLRDWDVSVDDVRARLRPGHAARPGDRRRLRDLRRQSRQEPLGRQDAHVHAAPAAARAPVPRRASTSI